VPETKISMLAPYISFSLPGDWSLSASFSRGKDRSFFQEYVITPSTTQFVGPICFCNQTSAWEIGAEGPLFHLGQNEARVALGIGTRTNKFSSSEEETGQERSHYLYGELEIPFVSLGSARPGLRRLELDLAARSEDYNTFGRVTTPKIGIIYDPSVDFTIKASWGRSFKTPTLDQRYQPRVHYLWSASQLGGAQFPADATVLMAQGGGPELGPERARTWSSSVAFHPASLPGFDAELSYFNINYNNRVIQPINVVANTLSDATYAQYVLYSPTEQQQQALIDEYGDAFYNYSGASYDPTKVVAIAQDQYVNVSRWRAKGLDLTGTWRLDLGASELLLRGTTSWLESSQQNGASQAPVELAGMIFNPAKLNSRIGAVWRSGSFSASGFVNYTQGVTSRVARLTEETASFTTFDTTLSYHTGIHNGALSGVLVSLSVQNLFNRSPPLYTVPPGTEAIYLPYDSTNYSAVGRYVSVSIAKHW
jgi:outer membrane receptor protein involved in Fe transport